MDDDKITIIDPNYRDYDAQTEYNRIERMRTAEKLAIAAAREQEWLNRPLLHERLATYICAIKQRIFSKKHEH